jgi:hypothetical protein
MKTQYVLTTMFYPLDYALQLTGYCSGQAEQIGKVIAPLTYTKIDMTSHCRQRPWGFRASGRAGDGSSNAFPAAPANADWRQITLDLNMEFVVDWVDWWPEQTTRIPTDWFMDVSLDGEMFVRTLTMGQFERGRQTGYVIKAGCAVENGRMTLLPVKARFQRLCFNEATRHRFGEWAVEIKISPEKKVQAAPVIQPIVTPPLMDWMTLAWALPTGFN